MDGVEVKVGRATVGRDFDVGGGAVAIDDEVDDDALAEGWIEGENVSCPWHAWCFELRTGRMTLGDYARIETFVVEIADGSVWLAPAPTASP